MQLLSSIDICNSLTSNQKIKFKRGLAHYLDEIDKVRANTRQ